MAEFDNTGRSSWVSDLAEIPEKYQRHQRLRRSGAVVRLDQRGRASAVGGADGHADQGPRRGPGGVGHRRGVDRRAAVADRGTAPAGNPRGHAEEIRLPPLGAADGPVKTAVFSGNTARLYGLEKHAELVNRRPLRRDQGRLPGATVPGGAICAMGMSASRPDAELPPRRWLLAARWRTAAARGCRRPPRKMSQAEAQYQATPRGGLSCVGCTFFRSPSSCQVVEGEVSPTGWCRLFDLPD